MLYIPNGDQDYRLLAIDPGTTTLGVALISVDLTSGLKRVVFAYTLNAAKSLYRYQSVIETQGERHARLSAHYNALLRMMREWHVHAVVSEAPYMGRFPQAYGALVECLQMIEYAVAGYDPQICLAKIDPASVKQSIGVPGKSGDKSLVKQAVLNLKDLPLDYSIDIDALDEHSWDGIAVGYAQLRALFSY